MRSLWTRLKNRVADFVLWLSFKLRGSTAERLVIGYEKEWRDFEKRHALFLERFPRLLTAIETAFLRTAHFSEAIDKFVFMYGRLCCEDFAEVLLCCGNGYGQAAMKLVRGLYERAVTLLYLQDHPEDVEDFLDYHHVSQRKLLVAIRETMGANVIPQAIADDVEQNYEAVKDRFTVPDCKVCGTTRLNHTWHKKLDLVSMAKKTTLGQLIVPGYFLPMRQAHSTVASLLSRLEETESGGVGFLPTAQRDSADEALLTAHNIILQVLGVQVERFKVANLKEQLETCMQDLLDILQDRTEARKKANAATI
jgi:hypothetical protein